MLSLLSHLSTVLLLIVAAGCLVILSKSADYLVDQAVKLSKIWHLSQVVIGATVVSLGTTLPELALSSIAALQKNGGFVLGNAVGSVIVNTGLTLGVAAVFGKIVMDRKTSQKLNLLVMTVLLLILPTIPYKFGSAYGKLPQWLGFIFLLLVPVYLFFLIKQEKNENSKEEKKEVDSHKKAFLLLGKILVAAGIISASASLLVDSVEVIASRAGISDVIISSTVVSLGTGLPELSTVLSSAKRKEASLALGNILGSNLLNILLVLGAAVALTPKGIKITTSFYLIHFAALSLIVGAFRFFAYRNKEKAISKWEGAILIGLYIGYLAANVMSVLKG